MNGGYQGKKRGWGHRGQATPLWGFLLPGGEEPGLWQLVALGLGGMPVLNLADPQNLTE